MAWDANVLLQEGESGERGVSARGRRVRREWRAVNALAGLAGELLDGVVVLVGAARELGRALLDLVVEELLGERGEAGDAAAGVVAVELLLVVVALRVCVGEGELAREAGVGVRLGRLHLGAAAGRGGRGRGVSGCWVRLRLECGAGVLCDE
mgnify:CR=1 FL=1